MTVRTTGRRRDLPLVNLSGRDIEETYCGTGADRIAHGLGLTNPGTPAKLER